MKIKNVWVTLTCITFLGCAQTSTHIRSNENVYSNYYENITILTNPNIKIHAIETLGNERLPKIYTLSKNEKDYLNSPDTTKTVFEVYITNNSSKTIKVKLGEFRSGGFFGSFNNEALTINPSTYKKSYPVVSVTSIYKAIKGKYSLNIELDGEKLNLNGEINRTLLKRR